MVLSFCHMKRLHESLHQIPAQVCLDLYLCSIHHMLKTCQSKALSMYLPSDHHSLAAPCALLHNHTDQAILAKITRVS